VVSDVLVYEKEELTRLRIVSRWPSPPKIATHGWFE
jgi:hypothetical protein